MGLYAIGKARPLTGDQYWRVPAYREMKAFGMRGFHETAERTHILWFDLQKTDFYAAWQGRLVVGWPPPERSWWRRSHRNEMTVVAVLEEGALAAAMPEWHELALTWADLAVLPTTWRSALSHWRGIYFVFDESDYKGYVGSACGDTNILGRWRNYAASGHGGNALLRKRDPKHFRFSILQRVSPDMDAAEVVRLEASWKQRLHTRHPFGLNEN